MSVTKKKTPAKPVPLKLQGAISVDKLARIPAPTLFLDLGQDLGWAYFDPAVGKLQHGVEKLKTYKDVGLGIWLTRFDAWLTKKHASTPFQQVVIEGLVGAFLIPSIRLFGQNGILECFVYRNKLKPTLAINNQSLKFAFIYNDFKKTHRAKLNKKGQLLTNKELMILRIQLYGFKKVFDENEADAISLALYYCSCLRLV